MRKLLRLREEYHACDAGSPRRPKLSREMTIFVREYRGLDSGAAKRSKGLLKTFLSRRRPSSPVTESPSKRRRRSSPASSVEIVDASPECEELAGVDSSAPVFPLRELRASLSTIEAEVGNVHVSIDNLAARLASESKDLRATAETGFVCFHFLVWSVHCLRSLGQCFVRVRQSLVRCRSWLLRSRV